MLKSPKEKGRRLELHVRDLIRGFGFSDTQRTPLSGGLHFMKGDITSKTWPFFTEVKNCETWTPLEWYRKAATECGAKVPIIVMSKNREDIYCFMLFSDLLNLVTNKVLMHQKFPKTQKQKPSLPPTNLPFAKTKMTGRKRE